MPKGHYVGKKIVIGDRNFKVVVYIPAGKVDSDGGYEYIVKDMETGEWDYFSENHIAVAKEYKAPEPVVEMTVEEICNALGKNVKIIK